MVEEEALTDHGVIVEYSKNGDAVYDYSDPYLSPLAAYYNMMKRAARRVKHEPELTIVRFHPWRLRYMNVVRVHFDDERWEELVPKLRQFWCDVVEKRNEPVDLTAANTSPSKSPAKSKKKKYEFIEESDDE